MASRNLYGGTHQLLQDWYGKRSNLDVAIEWFDGEDESSFARRLREVQIQYAERIALGRNIFVYLESPCNPHGYVLDVPAICRLAHEQSITVMCDATIATPYLQATLRRPNKTERPDFVIHSYTKDLSGSGNTTAGVVIARTERMFMPKGRSVTAAGHDGVERRYTWDETLFWNVYYIKGAFLDSDKAFEVLTGMRTTELRLIAKCINTLVLARCLALNPMINVHCSAVSGNRNAHLAARLLTLGLPAPLFTIDFEGTAAHPQHLGRERLKRLFDSMEPAFGMQVSLGLINTVVLCPALTTHSELSDQALADAGISASTMRISVGDEDPRYLLDHLTRAADLAFGDVAPEFVAAFASAETVCTIYEEVYIDVHRRWAEAKRTTFPTIKKRQV